MQHALNCSFSIRSENLSFWVEDGQGEMVAIVPLTIDISESSVNNSIEITQMNYGGGIIPFPVVSQDISGSRKKKILKIIMNEIDRLAVEYNVLRLVMKIPLTLSFCKKHIYSNELSQYGFLDASLSTVVVDLEGDEDKIWSGFSENHRRSIKKGLKYLRTDIINQKNISPEVFADFKDFYFRIAGKVTRPDTVFELLYSYIQNGNAVIARALHGGLTVGYVVSLMYKNEAYYLMGASERDISEYPISHAIHWELMKYLKSKMVRHYEIGIQQYGATLQEMPSAKEVSISRFKRGFGGTVIPLFIGEKFYSKKYFQEVWLDRINKYLKQDVILNQNYV
jgi:hypothetical protein